MRLRSAALGEGCVADDVAESLSDKARSISRSSQYSAVQVGKYCFDGMECSSPFGLVLLKDFSLGVIADVLDVDEAAQV